METQEPISSIKPENVKGQSFINHYFGTIPGFEEIGDALIRNKNGRIDYVESVRRLQR